jgi:hypothetical protein
MRARARRTLVQKELDRSGDTLHRGDDERRFAPGVGPVNHHLQSLHPVVVLLAEQTVDQPLKIAQLLPVDHLHDLLARLLGLQ